MNRAAGKADETRTRLLDAAVQAFAEKGFHGTTTRDIATAAGLSPAALYVHHRSKEELLFQIARAGHRQVLDVVREASAGTGDPAQRLVAVVHAFAMHHARNHTVARVVNYELAALDHDHLQEIRGLRQDIDRLMRDLVEDGVRAGFFHVSDVGMTASALLSLGIDLARWYRDDGGWTPEDIAEHYAAIAIRVVGGGRGASEASVSRPPH